MRVREIMSEPVPCLPSDTSVRPARIMREENAGFVPVVRDQGSRELVGVITDCDLCLDVVAEGRDPNQVQVQDYMTTNVVTCGPDDDVSQAVRLMAENQIRRIAVVDHDRHLAGVVSLADIAWIPRSTRVRQTGWMRRYRNHVSNPSSLVRNRSRSTGRWRGDVA